MNNLIKQYIGHGEDGKFNCLNCDYSTKFLHCVKIHIESKHIDSGGFDCEFCGKTVPTRNALKMHQKRNHSQQMN